MNSMKIPKLDYDANQVYNVISAKSARTYQIALIGLGVISVGLATTTLILFYKNGKLKTRNK